MCIKMSSGFIVFFFFCVLSLLLLVCVAQNQTDLPHGDKQPVATDLPHGDKHPVASLENIFQQESVLRNQLLLELIKDIENLKKKVNSRDQLISSLQQELATVRVENQQMNKKLLNLSMAYESRLAEVAFTAGIISNAAFRRDETVIFPRVITNKGNAYNPNGGIFTAPVNGIYSFYCSIISFGTNNSWVKITKNGVSQVVIGAYGSSDDHEPSASNIVNLELIKGDRVWVAAYSAAFTLFSESGNPVATFSGFLL